MTYGGKEKTVSDTRKIRRSIQKYNEYTKGGQRKYIIRNCDDDMHSESWGLNINRRRDPVYCRYCVKTYETFNLERAIKPKEEVEIKLYFYIC
jgi:hypothetical protein